MFLALRKTLVKKNIPVQEAAELIARHVIWGMHSISNLAGVDKRELIIDPQQFLNISQILVKLVHGILLQQGVVWSILFRSCPLCKPIPK